MPLDDPTNGPSPDWDKVPVRWRGVYLDGTPATGSLSIVSDAKRFLDEDSTTPRLVLGRPIKVPIGEDGSAVFYLPATDDPDITPRDFTYTLTEELSAGGGDTYSFTVPLAAKAEGVELARVVVLEASPGHQPVVRPELTYSRTAAGETDAVAAIREALATAGIITDSTTA